MNRFLHALKYILIYFGFKTIFNYIIFFVIPITIGNVSAISGTTGLLAVLFTLLFYRAERSDVVRHAPNRKIRLKYIVLTLVTLGIILFIYNRRKKRVSFK